MRRDLTGLGLNNYSRSMVVGLKTCAGHMERFILIIIFRSNFTLKIWIHTGRSTLQGGTMP
jgi:hypothetical protein